MPVDKKIIVKDGGLYKGGEKLKLEWGNVEQIEAIREHEKRISMFKKDGLELEPEFEVEITADVHFQCICNKHEIRIYTDAQKEGDNSCFHQMIEKCIVCKRKYKLRHYAISGEVVALLLDDEDENIYGTI